MAETNMIGLWSHMTYRYIVTYDPQQNTVLHNLSAFIRLQATGIISMFCYVCFIEYVVTTALACLVVIDKPLFQTCTFPTKTHKYHKLI